jgi:hypothetical protein
LKVERPIYGLTSENLGLNIDNEEKNIYREVKKESIILQIPVLVFCPYLQITAI